MCILLLIGIKWRVPAAGYVPGMGVVAGLALTFTLGLLVNTWGVRAIHLR